MVTANPYPYAFRPISIKNSTNITTSTIYNLNVMSAN